MMKPLAHKWYVYNNECVVDKKDFKGNYEDYDHILTFGGCGCCNDQTESIRDERVARLMAAAPTLLQMIRDITVGDGDLIEDESWALVESLSDIEFGVLDASN